MAIADRRKRRSRRRQVISRRLTDRENPLEYMSDDDLFLRFRFRAETILYIVSLVSNRLRRPTQRNSPLPPLTQVLVTLRFLATGGFYSLISDSFSAISAPSVFRSVRDVCTSLCSAAYQFVRMPTGSDADTTKQKFHKIAGFPNVLGCVDGTFVRIIGPKVNEGDYLNRKGYHSMNVQMICDAEYRFINCVAKWPGSVHDSRIFRDSRISVAFENGTYKGFLLGDSAYPCKTYLMTPFLSPACRSQEKYNRCHVRTRVLIEQSFGILKRRFSCLHSGLRTSPERACQIITACVVLHNIGIDRKDIINLQHEPSDGMENANVNVNIANDWSGVNVRNYICQSFFS